MKNLPILIMTVLVVLKKGMVMPEYLLLKIKGKIENGKIYILLSHNTTDADKNKILKI